MLWNTQPQSAAEVGVLAPLPVTVVSQLHCAGIIAPKKEVLFVGAAVAGTAGAGEVVTGGAPGAGTCAWVPSGATNKRAARRSGMSEKKALRYILLL